MVEKRWKIAMNGDSTNVLGSHDTRQSEVSNNVVHDLFMIAEEDPLSLIQAKAYRRELLFTKSFSLLLSEDGINPKDFDEDLEIEYGCKLDDLFKVTYAGQGAIKFMVPSNLVEARAMLQAKYQSILKAPLVASGMMQDSSKMSSPQSSKTLLLDASSDAAHQKKRSPNIKRTYGRSSTNTADADTASPPAKRVGKVSAVGTVNSVEPVVFSNIAEIEAHFYASVKGLQSYTETKGNYQFECCVCSEILDDNIKIIMHMHRHLGDHMGSQACRCETCYRWFMSEAEMELHQEDHSFGNSTYVCRICDSDSFLDLADLTNHMQSTHVRREMPYSCRLCGFRSSLYVDTVDHFNTTHAGSAYAQCAFCLQVYQLKPSAAGGPCRTNNFYDHVSRHHIDKEAQANCYRCRLSFLGFGDLPRHEKLEHKPGTSLLHCVSRFPATSGKSSTSAPTQQDMDLSGITIHLPSTSSTNGPALCQECSQPMARKGHFGRYTTCTADPSCAFASACIFAMASHASRHGNQRPQTSAPPLTKPLFCQCGFSSTVGAAMAAHLLSCSVGSRSCSTVPLGSDAASAIAFNSSEVNAQSME